MYSAELTIVPVIWLVFNLSTNRSKKTQCCYICLWVLLGISF